MLDQVLDLLQNRGRGTYRALKLQCKLDDDQLEALKDEILYAPPQVVDYNGRGLVWTGEASLASTRISTPATDQERTPPGAPVGRSQPRTAQAAADHTD